MIKLFVSWIEMATNFLKIFRLSSFGSLILKRFEYIIKKFFSREKLKDGERRFNESINLFG